MQKGTLWVLIGAGALLAGAFFQLHSNRRVASEVAALREELAAGAPEQTAMPQERPRPNAAPSDNAAILRRLTALEDTVAQLVRNSEYLMERGQLPVSTNKVADLFTKFTDATASDRDRLQALRLLRRSGGITDEALSHALNWAQGATNANTRDEILSSLEGLTNSILRDPLLAFALNDPNASVREQAVDSLRRFVSDPAIEAQLWKLINDPDVGRTAIQGILDGPKTEARTAALQERATNPNSSLEEKIVAWRALRTSNEDVQEISASLAQMAQSSQDPFERAKLIKAFDDAVRRPTSRDAVLLPPLIQGLQDASPVVREPAAVALTDYAADPTVQKWLRWAAENDPDPGVRKAAANAVINPRR
jgi:HEAT repeat protein